MRISVAGRTRAFSNRVVRAIIKFYATTLLSARACKNLTISVRFTHKFSRRTGAEMWPTVKKYRQVRPYIRKYHYTIKVSALNGPYRTLIDLAHEMIHVEQYIAGTMTETLKGTAWKGRVYRGDFNKDNDAYWNAPWEIDANGRSYWLYKRCLAFLLKTGYKLK